MGKTGVGEDAAWNFWKTHGKGVVNMHAANRILRGGICFLFIAVFAGCASAPVTTASIPPPLNGPAQSLRPGYEVVYYPKLQPGATLGSIQKGLDRISKENMADFVSGDKPQFRYWYALYHMSIDPDGIQFQEYGHVFKRSQLLSNLCYGKPDKLAAGSLYTRLTGHELLNKLIVVERGKGGGNYPYVIFFKDLMAFRFYSGDFANARTVADALYFLQQAQLQEQKKKQAELDKELARFKPIAAKYRALAVKPPVSEEQRKYIVQANVLAKQKQYKRAEEKYLNAIELDPTSYPGAYFNMALLAARENAPSTAIFRMKQYLLLVPDAQDARSAKDKIYEWELKVPSPLRVMTKVITDPPDAFIELNISSSGKRWNYIGRAPRDAWFWRNDQKSKFCLIRASKPGYQTKEKSFQFDSLPAEVHIRLRKSGSAQDSHGYLGIGFQLVTEALAKSSGLSKQEGVFVVEVMKNSPAERAGLQKGDIILTIEGREIKDSVDLPEIVAATPIGKTIDLGIYSNGQERKVKVSVGKLPG